MLLGDSVGAFLVRDAVAAGWSHPGIEVVNGARGSCDGMPNLPLLRARDLWSRSVVLRPPADCRPWPETYLAPLLAAGRADAAVLMVGQAPIVDALVDGRWRHPCDGIDWYLEDLAHRVELIRALSVVPVLALPAPPGPNSRFMYQDDYVRRSTCVRDALRGAAGRWRVPTYDLADAFCPGGRVDPCAATVQDGIHVGPQWAAPALGRLVVRVRGIVGQHPPQRGLTDRRPPRRDHGAAASG